MKIQPISSWINGQEKLGTIFNLYVIKDNLSTSATFYYSISTEEVSHIETKVISPEIPAWDETLPDGEVIHHDAIPAVTVDVLVIDEPSIKLVDGNVSMDGVDYQTWDSSVSDNKWAYNWAAAKLNLVAVV